jgi:hypothetical protein
VQLVAPERVRLMMLFAPVGLRSGSAALWASVARHRRELLSAQTVFTGSRLPAPTNPRNSLTSPGFARSHNDSFKPTRVVASATCFALRLHMSAAPPRVGLTQALGGRKAFCGFVARKPEFIGFGWQCSSDGLSARYSSVAVLCALRLGLRDGSMACAGVWAARFRLHGKFAVRAQFVRLRSFGKSACASFFSGSPAPNNSFKPTPCLGFVESCCLASNTGRSLPRSARLNSGVIRGQTAAYVGSL